MKGQFRQKKNYSRQKHKTAGSNEKTRQSSIIVDLIVELILKILKIIAIS